MRTRVVENKIHPATSTNILRYGYRLWFDNYLPMVCEDFIQGNFYVSKTDDICLNFYTEPPHDDVVHVVVKRVEYNDTVWRYADESPIYKDMYSYLGDVLRPVLIHKHQPIHLFVEVEIKQEKGEEQ